MNYGTRPARDDEVSDYDRAAYAAGADWPEIDIATDHAQHAYTLDYVDGCPICEDQETVATLPGARTASLAAMRLDSVPIQSKGGL